MKVITSIALLLISLAAISCDSARPQNPTVVLIVRHAEKVDNSDDPPLSEAGRQRAQALARVVEDSGLSAIYSTQYKRNRETVQPAAESKGIAITVAEVNLDNPGDYGKRLAEQIVKNHSGQTVLVVGHRNTMGAITEALSGKGVGQIEDVYSDLYMVVIPPQGESRLVKAKYGSS